MAGNVMLRIGADSRPRNSMRRLDLCSGPRGRNSAAAAEGSWGWRRYFFPWQRRDISTQSRTLTAMSATWLYFRIHLNPPGTALGPESVSLGCRFLIGYVDVLAVECPLLLHCDCEPYQAYAPCVGANRINARREECEAHTVGGGGGGGARSAHPDTNCPVTHPRIAKC